MERKPAGFGFESEIVLFPSLGSRFYSPIQGRRVCRKQWNQKGLCLAMVYLGGMAQTPIGLDVPDSSDIIEPDGNTRTSRLRAHE